VLARPNFTLRKISGELDFLWHDKHHQFPHLLSFPYFAVVSSKMPVFVRSVAPFLRTARSALQQGNSVSPLQHALRRKNGASLLNGARTYAAVFERTKPHVNIGMLLEPAGFGPSADCLRYNWSRRSRKGTGDSIKGMDES
jgi:hypothetical protein